MTSDATISPALPSPSPLTLPPDAKAVLTVTMGDPAGVGPEVLLRALAQLKRKDWPPLHIWGDGPHLAALAQRWDLPDISSYPDVQLIDCPIALPSGERAHFAPGALTMHGAQAQVAYIRGALAAIAAGRAQAIVTGPIHKQALAMCGLPYHGHTEWLADFAHTNVTMMLAGPRLRAVPVTCHIPLADVPKALTAELLMQSIQHTSQTLKHWFGITHPRIAVCGLNPHAGDGGLLGKEDDALIAPVIQQAQAQGMQVTGPHPGDTIFYFAHQGAYDAVVAMYHDQALAPLKLVHFDDAINLTMGLPFVRTSVDHGTAYDIAALGKASPTSMIEALRVAATMVQTTQTG